LATFLRDDVERQFLLLGPRYYAPQRLGVVGIDPSVVPRPAYRHIKLLAVDELSAPHRINIDDNTINRGALGGV
jgi:hypothetical protein